MTFRELIFLLLLFVSCDKATSVISSETQITSAPTKSIIHLKSLCKDNLHIITEDISISGYVTANGIYGEYSNSIVIESEFGGIEVLLSEQSAHLRYPFGSIVHINCNGLALGRYTGKVTLGAPPTTTQYRLDYISEQEAERHITQTNEYVSAEPLLVDFSQIDPSMVDTHLKFSEVRFSDTNRCFCDLDSLTNEPIATEHAIINQRGDSLKLRVSPSALFARHQVPSGVGTLTAILDYYGSEYTLRINSYPLQFDE